MTIQLQLLENLIQNCLFFIQKAEMQHKHLHQLQTNLLSTIIAKPAKTSSSNFLANERIIYGLFAYLLNLKN